MKLSNKIIYFCISVIFFIIADCFFSNQIVEYLRFNFTENSVLDLTYVENTGAAFSILANYNLFLLSFAIVSVLLILIYTLRNIEKFSLIAVFFTAMLLSGISCNLFERIIFGHVRDFFLLKFVNFPVFNISDIFISFSVCVLVIIIIKNKWVKNDKTGS